MVSDQMRQEMEEYLGQVPDWMTVVAGPASDHS